MPELTCIHCSEPLATITIQGQAVLACPRHGIWLQPEQLSTLTENEADAVTPEQERVAWVASDVEPSGLTTERFRSCPVCGTTLRKDDWKFGSSVIVDTCDEHGVWVDNGEIEHIEAWQEAWHAFADSLRS